MTFLIANVNGLQSFKIAYGKGMSLLDFLEMTDIRAAMGKCIAHYREAAGFKHREAAAKLKISAATILRVEKGKNWANLSTLAAMAELYGVRVTDFLTAESEKITPKSTTTRSSLIGDIVTALASLDEDKLALLRERVLGEVEALRLRTLKSDAANGPIHAGSKIK